MPQEDVRQFVRHDAGDFALACRRVEHAAMDEHRPAGQREGVDLLQVDWRERVFVDRLLQLRWRGSHEAVTEHCEIAGDRLVLDDWVFLADFSGGLLARASTSSSGV